MKLLCGIIIGDVKTGEGTRTALQLTCCMENEGAMICCSNVYLKVKEGTVQTRGCTCTCLSTGCTYMLWEIPMLHWEGCEVTLLVGTRVCIGWLRSILREIKESVNEPVKPNTFTQGSTLVLGYFCFPACSAHRNCPSWVNSSSMCLWFVSCRDLVLVWESIMGLL